MKIKNLTYSVILIAVLAATGCGEQEHRLKIAKLGINFGYLCSEEGATKSECIAMLEDAMEKGI